MTSTKRSAHEPRPLSLQRGAVRYAEGSCLITTGETRVLCAASVEEGVPGWRRGRGSGWVTAEYAMLPRATHTRSARERSQTGGRTQEIQRLIGRSLRACVDLEALGEWTIRVDCDVLQADGGTRTASITGGAVALYDACEWLVGRQHLRETPFRRFVAAISAGVVGEEVVLDLDYAQDSRADVDLNVVGMEGGGLVEVQGTGERAEFSVDQLGQMVRLAADAIRVLHDRQRDAIR
jgi:ribonuclease PH